MANLFSDALDCISKLDAELNSLSVEDVIKKDQLLEKAEELGFYPNNDEPYDESEEEPVEEKEILEQEPQFRPPLVGQPSGEYGSFDDECEDDVDPFEVDEGTSSGGTFDGKLDAPQMDS